MTQMDGIYALKLKEFKLRITSWALDRKVIFIIVTSKQTSNYSESIYVYAKPVVDATL